MTAPPSGIHLTGRRLTALLGEVDPKATTFRGLADRIRLMIIDGRLPLGTRLPSERELATALGRSRSTVVAAYNLLRDSGYLVSRRGSGTVTALPAGTEPARSGIDFAHAIPPPIDGLAEAMRRALEQVDRAVAGPGFDMLGDVVLRSRIADRYRRREVPTSPEQVMVTVGGQHAIALVARTLVRPGDRVLVESPSYPHAFEAWRQAGATLVATPATRDGWDEDHLLTTLDRVRPAVAYLVPDFQNPTGASMPPPLRAQVAATARRTGTILVVDETTADLSIDRTWDDGPFSRYGGAGGPEVITIGSLSKSMWGGLRIGWIRAGWRIIEQLAQRRPAGDLGTPRLEQLVASELVAELPALLPLRSAQLRGGRDHLLRELHTHLPGWDVASVDGGLSLWVGVGRPLSSSVALLSQARGLVVSAGPRFAFDGSQERFLRLPFTLPAEELSSGVRVLAQVWGTLADANAEVTPLPTVV